MTGDRGDDSAEGGSKRGADHDPPGRPSAAGRPANVAPDAVKDPSEKTDGKPGMPQKPKGGEADPGAG